VSNKTITIIGGGLAGCEAAWQAAQAGIRVVLYEMRPHSMTPAHKTGHLAELVCSNSLKSESLSTAHGLLKEELRRLGSLIIAAAEETRVPAGQALAVDKERFSQLITKRIESHPNIKVIREEITDIPSVRPLIIATGPLTSKAMEDAIAKITGAEYLYFYDAIAPSIEADSIDMTKAFEASRYDKGEGYINCPFDRKEDYFAFRGALLDAEKAPLHDFEKQAVFFEGCLPVEELAARGAMTLAYGPMKPVGLVNPKTNRRPWAVAQLRPENIQRSIYGLVGFQTRLTWTEQKRVFSMIPGLENAKFVRFGQIHRNTFINSPTLLEPTLQLKSDDGLFFAGQLIGVEGYVESAASGIAAGINAARMALGRSPIILPKETMIGALLNYVSNCEGAGFQPMNSNFGLLPSLNPPEKKDDIRRAKYVERALACLPNKPIEL